MTTRPTHHVPDERLLEYATGACSEAAALAIASHISLCALCSDELRMLDTIGDALLETVQPEPLAPGALEKVLAALDSPANDAATPIVAPEAEPLLAPFGVPRLLWRYLPEAAAKRGWRLLVPGIKRLDLRMSIPGTIARIVRLRPGLEIPLHDHGGDEYTMIFSGALSDDEGRFGRGDISVRPAGARHIQRVERGEPCIALVINEGPLVPLTFKGKLLTRIARG